MSRETEKLFDMLKTIPTEDRAADHREKFLEKMDVKWAKGIPPAPSFAVAPALTLACILLIGSFLYIGVGTLRDEPHAALLNGNVYIQRGETRTPLANKDHLKSGDRIITGAKDWIILELMGKYQIKIDPNSEVIIQNLKPRYLPGQTQLNLTRGNLYVSIKTANNKKYPFEVSTSNTIATAMGTQFGVSAPTVLMPHSWVGVLQGEVKVFHRNPVSQSRGNFVNVLPGNEVYVDSATDDLTLREMLESKRRVLDEIFNFSKRNQALLLISMGESRIDELLEPSALYLEIDSNHEKITRIKKFAHDIVRAAEYSNYSRQAKALAGLEQAILSQDEIDQVPVMLFIGAYYAFLEEHESALRVFRQIAKDHPESSYRSLALLAQARMHYILGDLEQAAALAQSIANTYPDSPEANPALSLHTAASDK